MNKISFVGLYQHFNLDSVWKKLPSPNLSKVQKVAVAAFCLCGIALIARSLYNRVAHKPSTADSREQMNPPDAIPPHNPAPTIPTSNETSKLDSNEANLLQQPPPVSTETIMPNPKSAEDSLEQKQMNPPDAIPPHNPAPTFPPPDGTSELHSNESNLLQQPPPVSTETIMPNPKSAEDSLEQKQKNPPDPDPSHNPAPTFPPPNGTGELDSNESNLLQQPPPVSTETIMPNPKSAEEYYKLALTLPLNGTVQLLDGDTKSQQWLYLKTIDLDPGFTDAYIKLALTLPLNGSVKLLDGNTKSQQWIFLKIIELDPQFADAYYNLALTLPRNETIMLNGSSTGLSKQDLFLKAIKLKPDFAAAYTKLGTIIPKGKTVELHNGTKMSSRQLYIKAIELDPHYAPAYCNLGTIIPKGRTVGLPDRIQWSSQQLYIKAIKLDSNLAEPYRNLALTLKDNESITLSGGVKKSKRDLMIKHYELQNAKSSSSSLGP